MADDTTTAEGLERALETAFRRFGGLPAMIRAPDGQRKIIATIMAEVRASRRAPTPPGGGEGGKPLPHWDWSNHTDEGLKATVKAMRGLPDGYPVQARTFQDAILALVASHETVKTLRERLAAPSPGAPTREAIHTWIREDCPLTVKMAILPEHVDALLARLQSGRPGAEERLRALREIKLTALTETGLAWALQHIVRLCIDAGVTEGLDALRRAEQGPAS